jgi:hypothetical protein
MMGLLKWISGAAHSHRRVQFAGAPRGGNVAVYEGHAARLRAGQRSTVKTAVRECAEAEDASAARESAVRRQR